MAQRVQIVLTDDLDGSQADSTVTFAYDGTTYEIDLSDANRAALQESLAPYIAAARKLAGGRRASGGRRKASTGASATDIRAWALDQGMTVSSRGRVSAEVREAYEAAH
ncbi:MAG: Lsr2 family protein [Propionicimonas sp.]|uniref:histone-like nucleoid-structuring protein Lsr2 n=1 Tax=Propionicimonas sp. TaxID=1955623 RepID=UPI002B21CA03|nr:Lsr2 family protein [Propionicimonas sp.]MEA4944906.1 Lsr2 family protein [Propionicimonas sp.]MEA5055535.1 Lsr2 family protein [Propionicimonas sp.]MEA5119590.1 Lsr2 family protein [Propionicimonas sp.]